jgi:hypothetical protein
MTAAETVIITCTRHRRRCVLAEPLKGGGIRIRHEGAAGAFGAALCDSERFTVRREQEASRGTAHAELVRLDLIEQAQATPGEEVSNAAR